MSEKHCPLCGQSLPDGVVTMGDLERSWSVGGSTEPLEYHTILLHSGRSERSSMISGNFDSAKK